MIENLFYCYSSFQPFIIHSISRRCGTFSSSSELLSTKSCFNTVMPQRWDLCSDQHRRPIEVSPVMRRNLLVCCFDHFAFRGMKKRLYRLLKYIDVVHSIHEYHFRFASADVRKYLVHAALIHNVPGIAYDSLNQVRKGRACYSATPCCAGKGYN